VFDDEDGYRNRLANCILRYPAATLVRDLLPRQAAIELFQNDPEHE
jgi:hypothetical protein